MTSPSAEPLAKKEGAEAARGVPAKLRAAVVGAGLMGGWHARYAARSGADVTAVVDRRLEVAGLLRRRFPGASAFDDLAECLANSRLDVVHVCTDAASHAPLIQAALLAGKHVLAEKPVAASVAELAPLVEIARQRDLKLMAVHQLPMQRGFRQLQKNLSRLGDLVKIEYVVCSAGGEGRSAAARSEMLLEMLPHPLSLLRGLLGDSFRTDCLEVLSWRDQALQLAGGLDALRLDVFLSLRGRPTRHELVVTGTRATAWLDLFHGFCSFDARPSSWAGKVSRPLGRALRTLGAASANLLLRTLRREPAYPGLLDLIRGFYGAVEGRASPPVGEQEMTQSLALIDSVRAAHGRTR